MSTTTPDTDSIIEKVRKLLRLAGNNPNEAEATLAMERAQELLAKYNLSMAQLDQSKERAGNTTPDTGKREKTKVERSAMFQYQRDLWEALSEVNYCFYWSEKIMDGQIYRTHHHWVLGREENVAVVKEMGVYLEQVINRVCPYKVGKDVHLWKLGCVERLCERLKEAKRESERRSQQEAESTTALTLIDVADREMHGNWLMNRGNSNWCPCRPCQARRGREWQEELAKRPAKTDAVATPVYQEKPETAKERRAREARNRRYQERWEKEYRAESAKRNSEAFQRGQSDANDVNLNKQVKGGK